MLTLWGKSTESGRLGRQSHADGVESLLCEDIDEIHQLALGKLFTP